MSAAFVRRQVPRFHRVRQQLLAALPLCGDRSRIDVWLDVQAERGARLLSEYSLAECFLGLYCSASLAPSRLVVGVAAEDVAEAGIRVGDLLGEPDGVDYCPAPAALADVWAVLAALGRDRFGRVDGTAWVPDPVHGASFAFVQGALGFVRELVPRIRRAQVRRWECRGADGACELEDLSPPGPLFVARPA